MRKVLLWSCMALVMSMTLFTSCSGDEEAQRSLTETISTDAVFTNAVIASVDLVLVAQDNQWLSNTEAISALIRKSEAGPLTEAEEAELQEMLGMTKAEYTALLADFGSAMTVLMDRYPSIMDMAASERQQLFAEAMTGNEAVLAAIAEWQNAGRACFLQDLCNLVVGLASLIGGPVLCDYIAGAIPVIGPLLCNVVIDLAEDILYGVCGILPC